MIQKSQSFTVSRSLFTALCALSLVALPANAEIIGMEVLSVGGDPNFNPTTDSFFDANFHQGLAGMGLTQTIVTLDQHGRSWVEFEIKVTRSSSSSGMEMVATDIDITNNTNMLWESMHFDIGMGLGDDFEEFDGLSFKGLDSAFPPNELLGWFPNVSQNRPTMPTEIWFEGPPGLATGQTADFWLAWKIPDAKFVDDMATITFRSHIIPAPSGLALLGIAGGSCFYRRRR